jgi:hypothetical protein
MFLVLRYEWILYLLIDGIWFLENQFDFLGMLEIKRSSVGREN